MRSLIFPRLCFVSLCSILYSAACTAPSPPYDPSEGPGSRSDLATSRPGDPSPLTDLAMPANDLGGPAPLDERFIGRWYIDQPYHALYEATFYETFGDGTMRIGTNNYHSACKPSLSDPCVTGWVGTSDRSNACTFGSKWSSPDKNTLIIQGECFDGKQRDIRLGFPVAAGRDVEAKPVVVSVDGAVGWLHNSFEWRFCKCPLGTDEKTCLSPGGC